VSAYSNTVERQPEALKSARRGAGERRSQDGRGARGWLRL